MPPAAADTDSESEEEQEGGTDVETEEDDEGDEESGHGRGGAKVSAEGGGRGGAGAAGPACCCVCMEPWICNDAHHICCIPCGHVYGRSCLERWLQHCGNMSAKCPQCGEQFEHKHITNLYAPGNLWDCCCCIQEVKAQMAALVESLVARHWSEFSEQQAKLAEQLRSELFEIFNKRSAELHSELEQAYRKQLDQDVAGMVKAFNSMKEQMKKMVEQSATPMDLIEFMEQAYTQLPIPNRPPADG